MGVPIVQGRVKRSVFDGVLEKIQNHLASWKGKLLNGAGRICLAKSVMTSIPIYTMQTLWFPQGICDRIDRLTRNFIWNGCTNARSFNLVNWDTMTKPKQFGGLGIRRARQTNIALIGKLVWRILNDEGGLWGDIIKHKYTQHRHGVSLMLLGVPHLFGKVLLKLGKNSLRVLRGSLAMGIPLFGMIFGPLLVSFVIWFLLFTYQILISRFEIFAGMDLGISVLYMPAFLLILEMLSCV